MVASWDSVDDLTLASPGETLDAFADNRSLLLDNAWVTLYEVLLGLAVSVVAGVGAALAMHLSRTLRDAAYPLLVASQAIPIVVLAPIFVLAFDYGIGPKLAIVALICFFPVTVNVLDGLRSVDPGHLKLMRRSAPGGCATCERGISSRCRGFSAACASRHGVGDWRGVRRVGGATGAGAAGAAGQQPALKLGAYAGIVILTLMAVALSPWPGLRAPGLPVEPPREKDCIRTVPRDTALLCSFRPWLDVPGACRREGGDARSGGGVHDELSRLFPTPIPPACMPRRARNFEQAGLD